MKNKKQIIFIIFLLVVILSALLKNLIPIPLNIRHICHLVVAPKDLYKPIVADNFPFDKKGASKTYKLNPKYFDFYDISIQFLNRNISSRYKFSGSLSVDFMYKGEVVSTNIADRKISAWYAENDLSKYKRISLLNFEIPVNKKYKDHISVRITVLEVDQELVKYKNSIKLHIAVSAIP